MMNFTVSLKKNGTFAPPKIITSPILLSPNSQSFYLMLKTNELTSGKTFYKN